MSLWTSTVICVLLFQNAPLVEEPPRPLVVTKKDWNVSQAYIDVFKILSNQNTCSDFYRGPRTATTVLNGFVTRVKSQPLLREVSFEMAGSPRIIRDPATGASYRLFEKTMVNTNGSFYQRRADPMRRFPSDVGNFAPGSRAARALILLHELGHLIQSESGDWLIPDDGYDGIQSKANTLRVQQACRKELNALN
jgi:hypothetical protein